MNFFKKTEICENCNAKIKRDFSYCPRCGSHLNNKDEDYGFLGKDDNLEYHPPHVQSLNIRISEKFINYIFNSIAKTLDKQFREMEKNSNNFEKTEIKNTPNGIKIRIGPSYQTTKEINLLKKNPTEEQLKKITSFQKVEAKSKVKRIGNKIIYELEIPGISSPDDVFISKLESGYEIKAIGERKIYINSIPITLSLKKLSTLKDKLIIEFNSTI